MQSVDPAGAAADKGLMPGDVITEAGQQPVATVSDLEARVQAAKDAGRKSILLLVRRAGEPPQGVHEHGARVIARDSLVKTALFGSDANWGRVLAAVGMDTVTGQLRMTFG